MPSFHASYAGIRDALAGRYGAPPVSGVSGAEAILPVFLRLLVEPARARQAWDALRDAGLSEAADLGAGDPSEINEQLRDRGIVLRPQALQTLQVLARYVASLGSSEALEAASTEQLRDELRAIRGIGPASADALLLQALGRPVYPVDRATYRILVRHGWIDSSAEYDEASALLGRESLDDPRSIAQLAYGFERAGTEFCRVKTAKCERCPLRSYLPEGGPLDPNE